ncbi:unnamed protein product [Phaedon cochleariae]|uniref:Caspase-3 n=1 Tax=Phaedon cochleariae TaxID=80249 RepID=A0A9N9SI44_PHACE|nr:unnamed protein product [Phaedon cochleariae]
MHIYMVLTKMWRKKKDNNVDNKTQINQGESSRTSTVLITTSGNITEYTTKQSSYSSTSKVTTTSVSSITRNEKIVPTSVLRNPDTANRNQEVSIQKLAPKKSLTSNGSISRTSLERDAKPYISHIPTESPGGYRSTFNRHQLQPFQSNQELTSTSFSRNTFPNQSRARSLDDTEVPTYSTSGKRRGKVLIINNVNFLDDKSDRAGALKDDESVSDLFKSMGFEVKVHRNLKKQIMIEKIKKFRSDRDLAKVDISVVMLMSHGNNIKGQMVMPGGYTEISGTDGKGLSIDEVLDEFDTKNCPGMEGKPKLFFFQCCRGDRSERIQTDAKPIKVVKQHGDMLIAHSTLPGFYSLRDTQKGSWYIQSICNVFKDHAKKHDVETMLKIVDENLSRCHPQYTQTTSYESRGFKRCYLNPIK